MNEISASNGAMDEVRYDPNDPVYIVASKNLIKCEVPLTLDNSLYIDRKDVLVFQTEPSQAGYTIEGRPILEFYASSDCTDTDWFVTLAVSQPNGSNMVLCGNGVGIVALRARHRNTWEQDDLLIPHEVYKYTIKLDPMLITIEKDQKLCLTLMNSCMPVFAVNHNTGNDIATDIEFKVATNKVFHSKEYPSSLKLPLQ